MGASRELAELGSAYNSGGLFGFRNRIINGAMVIDQRNAGASVTPTNSQYLVDRWMATLTQSSKFTAQRNAGSVTPPAGFTNYLGITSTSAYAITSTDAFRISQQIEGFNIADLAWGTANAQAITVSFWVRSSLTGTFGAQIVNGGATRAYPFTYTISAANTWEQKSVTIPGDTSGTWNTDNTSGMFLGLGLGYGTSLSGTANAWNAGTAFMPTGSVSVVGTNGATFYITGVQLEKGSTATSFDYRPYGTELALCQRYYYQLVTGMNGGNPLPIASGYWYSTVALAAVIPLPVTMRAAPSLSATSGTGYYRFYFNNTNTAFSSFYMDISSPTIVYLGATSSSGTLGAAGNYSSWNAASSIGFSAEL